MRHDFYPPESFLDRYDELVHTVYLHKDEIEGEEPRHYMKKGNSKFPVKDYDAWKLLQQIDRYELRKLTKRIDRFLAQRDEQYFKRAGYPEKLGSGS